MRLWSLAVGAAGSLLVVGHGIVQATGPERVVSFFGGRSEGLSFVRVSGGLGHAAVVAGALALAAAVLALWRPKAGGMALLVAGVGTWAFGLSPFGILVFFAGILGLSDRSAIRRTPTSYTSGAYVETGAPDQDAAKPPEDGPSGAERSRGERGR